MDLAGRLAQLDDRSSVRGRQLERMCAWYLRNTPGARRSDGDERGDERGTLISACTPGLVRLGDEANGRMRARVLAGARTTFASGDAQTVGLRDVLQHEILAVLARGRPERSTSSIRQATAQPDEWERRSRRRRQAYMRSSCQSR
jgi:hypothetical protein